MYGLIPGNAVVVNLLMRFPFLVVPAAVAGGVALVPVVPAEPVTVVEVVIPAKKVTDCVVLFETDKYTITTGEMNKLNLCLKPVNVEAASSLKVDGHTDSVYTPEYNKTLSKKRAATVKKVLIAKGFKPESIIQTDYHGLDHPVGDNNTTVGRSSNRRVTIKITE